MLQFILLCLHAYRAKIHEPEQPVGDHEEWEKDSPAVPAGASFLTRSMVGLEFPIGSLVIRGSQ